MAPPHSFYVPENYGGQQSVDDFDHNPTLQTRIVNNIHGIVNDFSKTFTTTFPTIDNKDNTGVGDFDSIDSAENAVFGNRDDDYQDTGSTLVQETTSRIVNDITTEINKFTNFFTDGDVKHISSPEFNFSEDKSSPNLPYIILVVILAVLVVITIIALVIYQKKKAANSKSATGVTIIGKTFNKSESDEKQETQMPQQIMYGEQ